MRDSEKYNISISETIKHALVLLNSISHDSQTLFVVDDENKMVGTLTDGDIRRGLISGSTLDDAVSTIMHTNFKYVLDSELDVLAIKKYRENRIMFVPVLDSQRHIVDVLNLICHRSYLPIDAVLMAGGKGERLRPLTEKTPKPLLPVGGKAIIDHNVDRLISFGIKHISVTVNYLHEQIEEHYQVPRNNIQVKCYKEPKFLGTIGSIKFVEGFHNDTILVMNSDLFTNIDYEDFYLHFKEHNADMSIAAIPYDVSIPYGILDLDGRYVKGLLEKPHYNYYANAGIYLMKKSVLSEIPSDTFFNATDLIESLIQKHLNVIRYPLNGTWIDIGNPQEYRKAQDLIRHIC